MPTSTAGCTGPCTIAYLTSSYGRATDTFIRDEVTWLRAAGDVVHTYSVRKPAGSEVVDDEVAIERDNTTYLLDLSWTAYLVAALAAVTRSPRRFARAISAARALSREGMRARVWPAFYLAEACVLAKDLRRRRVHHLHNHIGEGSASVAMLASILSEVPYSFTVHGPSEWDAPVGLGLDVKAAHAAFVATISNYTQGQMRRWVAPEDWKKVKVVRCGVRVPEDNSAVGASEETTLVSVGRLAREKGHLVLLQALVKIRAARPLRVLIVGDGPERQRLTTFIKHHDLDSVVELVGWRSPVEVQSLLRDSTALIMPSFAEGLPVSIMEAYALGKPVISSDVGAVDELVQPGRSGWLVPAGSVGALASALREMLDLGGEARLAMGSRGRETVLTNHDVDAEVARLRHHIVRSHHDTSRHRD